MKHEIEIPDLPEGYEIGKPKVVYAHMGDNNPVYISIPLKKKQPRRIVLEETCETTHSFWHNSIHFDDIIINIDSKKRWKIV